MALSPSEVLAQRAKKILAGFSKLNRDYALQMENFVDHGLEKDFVGQKEYRCYLAIDIDSEVQGYLRAIYQSKGWESVRFGDGSVYLTRA